MPTKHKSRKALAAALGFSAQALENWKAQFADVPQTLVEEDWRAFIVAHDLGSGNNRLNRGHEDLKRRKLASEIRINELKISKEERKVIPAADVDAFLLHLGSRVKSAVFQLFVTELPPAVVGLPVEELRIRAREKAETLCVSMQNALAEWVKQQESARPIKDDSDVS